jgi:hypothetical protein
MERGMKLFNFAMVLLFPCVSYAYSRVDTDIKEIIKDSKYIFTARVVSVEINKQAKEHYRSVVADIEIQDKIKGNPEYKRVYSGFGGGDCGLIFNGIAKRHYVISVCSVHSIHLPSHWSRSFLAIVT